MWLWLWTLWAGRSAVHKSTGFAVSLVEVDGADAMGAIVDGEHPILAGRAEIIGVDLGGSATPLVQ